MAIETLVERATAAVRLLAPDQVAARLDRFLIVDVREPDEVLPGFLPGAINVPRGVLEFRASEDRRFANKQTPILLYSNNGGRSALAALCLSELGYCDVAALRGGLAAWSSAGLPIE